MLLRNGDVLGRFKPYISHNTLDVKQETPDFVTQSFEDSTYKSVKNPQQCAGRS
jgi:hypothetical protein